MRRLAALTVMMALAAFGAQAKTVAAPGQVVAARAALFTTVPDSGDIRSGTVTVELGQLSENPKWELRSTVVPILVELVSESMVRKAGPTDNLWKNMKRRDKDYKGLTVRLRTVDGHAVQPLRVFEGRITTDNGRLLASDPGRAVEFWLFGTARIKGDQMVGGRVMPVLSFDQCRVMGNAIVNTTPRQCLLPDDGIMLETDEKPTVKSLKAVDFDSCLLHGQSLIYTFPRRCVAAGGRVFTEPPRVYEAPAHPVSATAISTATGVSATAPDHQKDVNEDAAKELAKEVVSETAVSVTAAISGSTVSGTQLETRKGLGVYAVSPGVPVTSTQPVSASMMLFVPLANVASDSAVHHVSATVAVSTTVTVSTSVAVSATVTAPPVPSPSLVVPPVSTTMPVAPVVSVSAPVGVSSSGVGMPVSVTAFGVTLGKVAPTR